MVERMRRMRLYCGDVAQLGERGLCKPEVVGSIPIVSTMSWMGRQLELSAFFYGPLGVGRCLGEPEFELRVS